MKKKTRTPKKGQPDEGPAGSAAETAARHIAGLRTLTNMQLVLLRDLERAVLESIGSQKKK